MLPPNWRRVATRIAAVVSAGWVVPMYFAISHYFSGLEDWLFSIRTNGAVYKISRLFGADIELAIALGWLALVIIGWTMYWDAQHGAAADQATRRPGC